MMATAKGPQNSPLTPRQHSGFSLTSDKNHRIFCLKTYNRDRGKMIGYQPRSFRSQLFGERNEWKVDGSVYQWKRKKF